MGTIESKDGNEDMSKFTVKVVGSATYIEQYDEGFVVTVTNRFGRVWQTKRIVNCAGIASENAQSIQAFLDAGQKLDITQFEEVTK